MTRGGGGGGGGGDRAVRLGERHPDLLISLCVMLYQTHNASRFDTGIEACDATIARTDLAAEKEFTEGADGMRLPTVATVSRHSI